MRFIRLPCARFGALEYQENRRQKMWSTPHKLTPLYKGLPPQNISLPPNWPLKYIHYVLCVRGFRYVLRQAQARRNFTGRKVKARTHERPRTYAMAAYDVTSYQGSRRFRGKIRHTLELWISGRDTVSTRMFGTLLKLFSSSATIRVNCSIL